MMTFNEYQDFTKTTFIVKPEYALMYAVLELASEAGEVADKLKKIIRDKISVLEDTNSLANVFELLSDEDKLAMAKELGDVMYPVAIAAAELGYTLQDIADMNKEKLVSRQQRNVLTGSGDNR